MYTHTPCTQHTRSIYSRSLSSTESHLSTVGNDSTTLPSRRRNIASLAQEPSLSRSQQPTCSRSSSIFAVQSVSASIAHPFSSSCTHYTALSTATAHIHVHRNHIGLSESSATSAEMTGSRPFVSRCHILFIKARVRRQPADFFCADNTVEPTKTALSFYRRPLPRLICCSEPDSLTNSPKSRNVTLTFCIFVGVAHQQSRSKFDHRHPRREFFMWRHSRNAE